MSIYEQPDYSPVELKAIEKSPLDPLYASEEQIPVIAVGNFPAQSDKPIKTGQLCRKHRGLACHGGGFSHNQG